MTEKIKAAEPLKKRLFERLHDMDAKLAELTALIEAHMHALWHDKRPRLLLVGWPEIGQALRKSPSTLRRYVRRENMPVVRWGRHVVTTPGLIEDWLLTREERKRARLWKPQPGYYQGPDSRRRANRLAREAQGLTDHMAKGMDR